MQIRQIFRDHVTSAGVGRSPVVKLFGLWKGQSLLTAHEAITLQRKKVQGVMRTVPVGFQDMEDLAGADCFDAGGPLLGSIDSFDNPGQVFGRPLSPVIFIDTREGLNTANDPKWDSGDAVSLQDIIPALRVRILGTDIVGEVVEPVGTRTYLDTKETEVAVLKFDVNLNSLQGSPVVVESDATRLVGMLFNAKSAAGTTFAFCYPAKLIP